MSMLTSIVEMPRNLKGGDSSAHDLLRRSGYFEGHARVSEAAVLQALRGQPDRVEDWLRYSEDKRSGGWFLRRGQSGYHVGRVPAGERQHPAMEYTDAATACAAFIKREIEDIRIETGAT